MFEFRHEELTKPSSMPINNVFETRKWFGKGGLGFE